ncbi:growth arrest-specific protein 7-like isoform X1 [Pungitius pungitius]|uniref:growth arrest-specific protein 7-like isoform X1 n=1 Tax=Pungitius pungitius TaxID=134920 RepID=UPI002E15D98E
MKPAAARSAAPEEDSDRRPLPPGWRSYTSPEGLRYYVNSCSKETTWRRPPPSAEAPQKALAPQSASPYADGCHGTTKPAPPTEAADVTLRKAPHHKQVRRRRRRVLMKQFGHPSPNETNVCEEATRTRCLVFLPFILPPQPRVT